MTFILLQVFPRCHYNTDSAQKTLVLSRFKLKNYDQDSLIQQSSVLLYFFEKKIKGKFKRSQLTPTVTITTPQYCDNNQI